MACVGEAMRDSSGNVFDFSGLVAPDDGSLAFNFVRQFIVTDGDEHVIKFADTAADVYARTGNRDASPPPSAPPSSSAADPPEARGWRNQDKRAGQVTPPLAGA